jgi:PAS domain S-box-containing protein
MEYIDQINDDDLKKRDLEALKRKNDNFGEHINLNFYSVLFSKETGIIIANGDKGSEGIIQLANNEIENIFKYKPIDLKGKNISILMPKIFAINHSKYIERYFKIGEKKFIDKSVFKSFGKEKNNCIIKIRIALKLFPILNDNIYFIALIVKENVDDIILLDDKFNIQGMSLKLMKILNINNKSAFQDNEIPFYVICKKFLNFYDIFLKGKKKWSRTLINFFCFSSSYSIETHIHSMSICYKFNFSII